MVKVSGPLLLSVVVPVFNESSGLQRFQVSLVDALKKVTTEPYEIIYCDDGSTDNSAELVKDWHKANQNVKLVALSRNFGKEAALAAGIAAATGQAVITIDGDGQHPVELVSKFVDAWKRGSSVVIGVRTNHGHLSWTKRLSTKVFYGLFNKLTNQELLPGSTDFRLIDRSVQQEFMKLNESERVTRGLIDWLGFSRSYIRFEAKPRLEGSPTYTSRKLMQLAKNSFVSLTPKPLYIFGYLGVLITILTLLLGIAVIIEQLLLSDPLHWKFTGTAMLGILIAFLVGLVLMSQAVLSLYISNIQNESKGRPLYVIDFKKSAGIESENDK